MVWNIWIDLSGKDLPMTIISLIFVLAWIVQMIWYWGIFSQFAFYSQKSGGQAPQAVSVVIAAKNEYHNLMRNLRLVLEQDYPEFEVIVVNDASDDETEDFLKEISTRYAHLNVVNIRSSLNYFRGKKFPLALGIKSAKHEILLLTDADCRPDSPNWIREMQSQFDDATQFVLGYGAYEAKPGLINRLIRWETVHIAMQYFSHALAGHPYMGVGRNLAYRRSQFIESGGFASHYHISGGDDDLYVNRRSKGKTTRICMQKDAQTLSSSPPGFSYWIRQKRRHLSTGRYYKKKHLFLLGMWTSSQVVYIVLALFLAFSFYNIIPLCSLILLRTITQLIIFKKSMLQLSERKLLLFSPIFELFFIIFNFLLVISNLVKKNQTWK